MSQLYRVSREADNDLEALWEYIARDKPGAATNLLAKLHDHFHLLSRHPLLGEARDEVVLGLRSFPVGNYVIYDRVPESGEFKSRRSR